MRAGRMAVFSLLVPLVVLASRAYGQNCPDPVPIGCGDIITANNCAGTDNFYEYPCITEYTYDGPENFYLLTLEHGAELTIELDPLGLIFTWDAALIMVPELDGDCYASVYNGCSDETGSGGWEGLTGVLPAGNYYLIIDGYNYGDCGDYDLYVTCTTQCTGCADGDGDGYAGYNASNCPCGSDCNDSDPARNPGADEICGDGIDQDCDGGDAGCPACGADLSVLCNDNSTASTDAGSPNLNGYCNSGYTLWGGDEYVLGFTPASDGNVAVTISNMGGQQLDAFAFTGFGVPGVCNKDACVDASTATTGFHELAFFTEAGETYYVAVDGRSGDHGSFDYALACLDESCTATGQLGCGTPVTGDTSGGSNTMTAYRGFTWHFPGPEAVYSFTSAADVMVDVVLHIDAPGGVPPDLALIVIEDDGNGACLPGYTVAGSDFTQDGSSNPPEVATFLAAADVTYYVVVDSFAAGDQGSFTLRADCAVECLPGQTDCGGVCVDTQTDVDHCGACNTPCNLAHATPVCTGGTCQIGACDTGWDDCDSTPQSGCETDLATVSDCGQCGLACAFDHASASCPAGTCTLGACDAGWGNCDGVDSTGCEAALDTAANCGSCGNACGAGTFCYNGGCVTDCPGGLTECGGACVDTTNDVNNCGGCGTACTAAHGTPSCVNSACRVASCDAGYADCNADATDGCETTLGTNQNCTGCGDTCDFPHASGRCEAGACVLGPCEAGWNNCDTLPGNGCEADLTSEQTCGSCTVACGAGESCINGQCSEFCDDADQDGHEDINCGGDDCDDGDDSVYPGAPETCGDTVDQDCDGQDEVCDCVDRDADGHMDEACGGDDCNDLHGYVFPGQTEDCSNQMDDDCDDLTDCADADCAAMPVCQCDHDGDGHNGADSPCGGPDCDDSDATIHPNALDNCGDGIDQNCDGEDRPCPSDGGCGCGASGNSRASLAVLFLGFLVALRRRVS